MQRVLGVGHIDLMLLFDVIDRCEINVDLL